MTMTKLRSSSCIELAPETSFDLASYLGSSVRYTNAIKTLSNRRFYQAIELDNTPSDTVLVYD